MLNFFRKYQRFFFIMITIVIVISFSFFGTYNAFPVRAKRNGVAFTAIDGTAVTREDLEQMVLFLGSDEVDKLLFGGRWGPNFLNDGVIINDFLKTGMAAIIVENYKDLVKPDLESRLKREKRYIPYRNPDAKFIKAEKVWEYFAPNIIENLQEIKRIEEPTSPEGFQVRSDLFLSERAFPQHFLRQALRYQESQLSWLPPDASLEQNDLSLFGYHSIEDWFGPKFMRLISEFIINAAKIAEEKGYRVTEEEAQLDLVQNAERSFQKNAKSPFIGAPNFEGYMNLQLRRMGMDKATATSIWRQVMLFRRLFHAVGNSVFTDPITYQQFHQYAAETVKGDLYQLPEPFRFATINDMHKFEVYLTHVARKNGVSTDLPNRFYSVDQVIKNTPELVQKKFHLEVSQLELHDVTSKITIKETWDWEVHEDNWKLLIKNFSKLAASQAKTREQRFEALESLDPETRRKVDLFAREMIVKQNPALILEAMELSEQQTMHIGLTLKGAFPLEGIVEREKFILLLQNASEGNEEAIQALNLFSGDGEHYYRIRVLETFPPEILTFEEANQKGNLDELLNNILEKHYVKIREKYPELYQNSDGTWKPFQEFKDAIAKDYFSDLHQALKRNYIRSVKKIQQDEKELTGGKLASLRFYSFVKQAKEALEKGQPTERWVDTNSSDSKSLEDQWKIRKTEHKVSRSQTEGSSQKRQFFEMEAETWTDVIVSDDGDIHFFYIRSRGVPEDQTELMAKLEGIHQLISNDTQRTLTEKLLEDMKNKNAISLDFLNLKEEP